MGEKVVRMYELFVRGYIDKKVENGYMILGLDDEIDAMKRANTETIKCKIREDIDYLEPGIQNILISRGEKSKLELISREIGGLAELRIVEMESELADELVENSVKLNDKFKYLLENK